MVFTRIPTRSYASLHGSDSNLAPVAQALLREGLSETFQLIERPDENAAKVRGKVLEINNLKELASWSWVEDEESGEGDDEGTLLIPGAPRAWRPRPLPLETNATEGTPKRSALAVHSQVHPYEALLRVLSISQPNFSLSSVDVLADRSALLALYKFGASWSARFRIDATLAGSTVVLELWCPKTDVKAEGMRTVRREFITGMSENVEGSDGTAGHWRAISYDLGGLSVMTSFKVDAFLPGKEIPATTADDNEPRPLSDESSLHRVPSGETVPHSQLVDARLRAKPPEQLELPSFLLAKHARGLGRRVVPASVPLPDAPYHPRSARRRRRQGQTQAHARRRRHARGAREREDCAGPRCVQDRARRGQEEGRRGGQGEQAELRCRKGLAQGLRNQQARQAAS